jgi:hypothetical protein
VFRATNYFIEPDDVCGTKIGQTSNSNRQNIAGDVIQRETQIYAVSSQHGKPFSRCECGSGQQFSRNGMPQLFTETVVKADEKHFSRLTGNNVAQIFVVFRGCVGFFHFYCCSQ